MKRGMPEALMPLIARVTSKPASRSHTFDRIAVTNGPAAVPGCAWTRRRAQALTRADKPVVGMTHADAYAEPCSRENASNR